jgi:predicted NBD/HSP70 family sugar kinase
MEKIALDIGWTKIVWTLFRDGSILKTRKIEIGEYHLDKVTRKIQDIIDEFLTPETWYIGISLNGQMNNGYIYFSRVLWWRINDKLINYLRIPENIEFRVDNDVNCMCLWIKYLEKNLPDYYVLLNIWTWLRTSYSHNGVLLRWSRWFFGEIRDNLDILELDKTININDLICGRWIANIYKLLTGDLLSAEDIYLLSKSENEDAKKSIKIFLKYFINLLCRISYTYNPQLIIIDGSVKVIVQENLDEIMRNYTKECEEQFLAKIEISIYENTAIYWALNIE